MVSTGAVHARGQCNPLQINYSITHFYAVKFMDLALGDVWAIINQKGLQFVSDTVLSRSLRLGLCHSVCASENRRESHGHDAIHES